MRRRVSLLILMLFGLLLAGCSARPDAGLTAALGESGLVLDLPAITVDYDESGAPTLAGVTPAELAAVLPGGLDRLRLPSAAIEVARNAGIQHVQMSNTPQGLRLFVNGAALPGLAWDATRLQNAAALAAQFGLTLPPELVDLLPILPQLGIGVTVHFPHPADAAAIPPASADVTGAAFSDGAARGVDDGRLAPRCFTSLCTIGKNGSFSGQRGDRRPVAGAHRAALGCAALR
jgi:hypothetical protein